MNNKHKETRGERLKYLRNALGHDNLTLFSDITGMSEAHIRAIEDNKRAMNDSDCHKVGKVWPWAVEYLLTGGELY